MPSSTDDARLLPYDSHSAGWISDRATRTTAVRRSATHDPHSATHRHLGLLPAQPDRPSSSVAVKAITVTMSRFFQLVNLLLFLYFFWHLWVASIEVHSFLAQQPTFSNQILCSPLSQSSRFHCRFVSFAASQPPPGCQCFPAHQLCICPFSL